MFNLRARRGFTLTELAIVLGVMGSILGAIWVASSRVVASNKSQKASAETLAIINNYRSLYTQHGVDTADWVEMTCNGVNNGFFPSEMVTQTCSNGNTTTYPSSPWGTAAGGQFVQVWSYQSTPGIIIGFGGLTQTACNNLTNAITASPDMIWENINATNQQWISPFAGGGTPYTTAQIASFCLAGSTNFIQIMFKAR